MNNKGESGLTGKGKLFGDKKKREKLVNSRSSVEFQMQNKQCIAVRWPLTE